MTKIGGQPSLALKKLRVGVVLVVLNGRIESWL